MRVLIEYTQTGKYRDQAWEALTIRSKGEIQAVTPSYAAQLIEQNRACVTTTEHQDIVIQP